MKTFALFIVGCGLLFAGVSAICMNPVCGHPKWTHGKGGACAFDTCTHYMTK